MTLTIDIPDIVTAAKYSATFLAGMLTMLLMAAYSFRNFRPF